jgi:hypothetical protein
MADIQEYAGVVALAIKAAMAPVLERVALMEAQVSAMAKFDGSVTELRERLVVAETKAALLPSQDVLVSRLAALESKSVTLPVSAPDAGILAELNSRVESLEQRQAPPAPVVTLEDVAALRDRLMAIETKAVGLETRLAVPDPLGATVEKTERALADLSKDVGTLRERVAVAEVRQLTPGPAGAAGKDGKDGKDGVDGLGYDDLLVEQSDRSFTIKAVRGDRVKTIGTATFPTLIQRGVYVEGESYERGDVVTWGGSQWHANESTTSKPGEGTKAWTLVVKRGRDGRDGKDAVTLPVVSVGGTRG